LQIDFPANKRSLVLFDCKMGSGHFGSSGRCKRLFIVDAYWEENAGDYAFVIGQLLEASK
jgi:protease II